MAKRFEFDECLGFFIFPMRYTYIYSDHRKQHYIQSFDQKAINIGFHETTLPISVVEVLLFVYTTLSNNTKIHVTSAAPAAVYLFCSLFFLITPYTIYRRVYREKRFPRRFASFGRDVETTTVRTVFFCFFFVIVCTPN